MAGVWDVDVESMEFHIGDKITLDEITSCFEHRVKQISDNKFILTGFIEFQYGELSNDCKPHRPVIKRLEKLSLLKGYQKGFRTLEDKEKEKEKDQDKEKDRRKSKIESNAASQELFDSFYLRYPKKEGKKAAFAKFTSDIKNEDMFAKLMVAEDNYLAKLKAEKIELKFTMKADTFMNNWRDYLDYVPEIKKQDRGTDSL
jgi:hypothetical protein